MELHRLLFCNYFREIKKSCTLEKNCSLILNTVNYKEKIFSRNNYFGSEFFFMSCHFPNIFVHLLIIAAVSNFNVFKLIGWDSANTFLMSTIETLEKEVKYVQSQQQRQSNVILVSLLFTLNIFHIFF